MDREDIYKGLTVVKLDGSIKFPTKGGYYAPSGYCLKHKTLGYFSFAEDKDDFPYIPYGGRKLLQGLLDRKGIIHFDNAKWLEGKRR